MNHFIRKHIFRAELEYIFIKYSLSETIKNEIIKNLFPNFYNSSKLVTLSQSFTTIEQICSKIQSITGRAVLVKEVEQSIFLMQDDLDVPSEIKRDFSNNEKIAIFVGAGVSKLLDLPLWPDLANESIKFLHKHNIFNNFETTRIINEVQNSRQKITIFHLQVKDKPKLLKQFYEEQLKCKSYENKKNPYEILAQFDCLKLTSNVDEEFHKALKKIIPKKSPTEARSGSPSASVPIESETKPVLREPLIQGFSKTTALSNDLLYQIHGSISDINSIKMTTRDYIDIYSPKNGLYDFLEEVFRQYRVIFIGYGLEEFEILSKLLHNASKTKSRNNFVLLPMFQSEIGLFRAKQAYFEDLNITPVHYYLDVDGHYRLVAVLESWLSTLGELKTAGFYDKAKVIDRIVD